MHFISFLEDILFPVSCVFCGADGRIVCGKCVHALPLARTCCAFCGTMCDDGRVCVSCERRMTLEYAKSVFQYSDARVQKIIELLKFKHQFAVLENIKHEIAEQYITFVESVQPDILIPIPASRASFVVRGYNPAELVARVLRDASGIPIRHVLSSTNRPAQHFQKQRGRMRGLETFFSVHRLAKTFKRAMVIDDILTTGGTVEAAARTLHTIGFEHISAFTLARQEKYTA